MLIYINVLIKEKIGGIYLTDKKKLTVWIKRLLSLMSIAYVGLMLFLAKTSLYYDVNITHPVGFTVLIVFLVILFGGTMLYSRKQFLTSVAGMLGLLLYMPVVILNYNKENAILLIPVGLLAVLLFFFGGAGEGLKTIVGTIYLLLYIVCILAYYLYVQVFAGKVVDTITYQSISETENYRCFVHNIDDTSDGTTKIIVEPNFYDKVFKDVTFVDRRFHRIVYNVRAKDLNLKVEWSHDAKNEDLLKVDGEIRFKSSDALKSDEAYRFFDEKDSWKKFKFFQ